MNERDFGLDRSPDTSLAEMWLVRSGRWFVEHARPDLGWLVLGCCIALALLPALLLAENRWLLTSVLQGRLFFVGPLAVAGAWLLLGWRGPCLARPAWLRRLLQLVVYLVLGLLLIGELLAGWLPTYGDWQQALAAGSWAELSAGVLGDLGQLGARYALWWQGVQQNNAARDDLVIMGLAAVLLWLMAGTMVWLVRRFQRGLVASLPILWPMGFIMLYSPAGRWLFVAAVALALLLHLLLDQRALVRSWEALGLDYSPAVLLERTMLALAAFAIVLAWASFMPNLYIYEITARYYTLLAPMNERLEATGKRLFPGLTGVVPWAGRGIAGGLPNAFLLGAGPELGDREVMRVRTSEPVTGAGYDAPPLGHNLSGGTFADYDGRGWDNLTPAMLTAFPAETPWRPPPTTGRRPMLQSINLSFGSQVLFAATEPLAPSVDYTVQERWPGEQVAINARARSYTIVSQVPALSTAELDALPAWDPQALPLPPEYAVFLALPETVTGRTRDLAQELTGDQPTAYAKATAIEAYLRTIEYDLDVPTPPEEVTDVADYFLFDLRRGYCDYYATAFAVLARLSGLPTRFVTGFSPGAWSFVDQQWIVTEASAHSWPEVYFPEVGWIPFEPTAARPQLPRIGLPDRLPGSPTTPLALEIPEPQGGVQLSFWWFLAALVPLAIGSWGILRWRAAREDPWLAVQRWGRRAGRPLQDGETAQEYGTTLAHLVQEKNPHAPDMSRTAARELRALGAEVSAAHYAPEPTRPTVHRQIVERWKRLRSYLGKLR
jgi:hypothetical protein